MNRSMENPKVYGCKGCGKVADYTKLGVRPFQLPLKLYCTFCQCEKFEVYVIEEKVGNENGTPQRYTGRNI